MKTKNGNDDAIINKGLKMALKCDQEAKEEIIKHVIENRRDNRLHIENVALQYEKNVRKISL